MRPVVPGTPVLRAFHRNAHGHYTSAAVEGINNKGRVITKRCYGVKSAGTFFKRIMLDVNRASEAVGRSIVEVREIIAGLKAVFLQYCT